MHIFFAPVRDPPKALTIAVVAAGGAALTDAGLSRVDFPGMLKGMLISLDLLDKDQGQFALPM